MYKVNPYLINDVKQASVIQTGRSTVVINDQELKQYLKDLESNRIVSVSSKDLANQFPNKGEEVSRFLLQNRIFSSYEKPTIDYENIFLFSNNDKMTETFNYLVEDLFDSNRFFLKSSLKETHEVGDGDLVFIFLNPFILEEFLEVVNDIKQKSAIIKVMFYYNHSIYVSHYSKDKWKNPCPKCFYYSLETQLRGEVTGSGPNFQTIIDLIYRRVSHFNVESKLSANDLLPAIESIVRDFKFEQDVDHFINKAYEFSIEQGTKQEDLTYHWEMCDCYE
ncbi:MULTISPECIES: McbB family protein [Bacillaceae]|uniref:McbB family protein n=1 Tax=Alkalicoccobacillus plakortidis TaxID=444060 RepID=A0A9D5DQ78_9BACI|nr:MULTISPECIES: McbB family protein [Bacillaceae]KQL58301.1 hypothetical protein AN965_04380 [Alkalicoccobacillus plakortidis]